MFTLSNVDAGKIKQYYAQDDYYFSNDETKIFGNNDKAESFRGINKTIQRGMFEKYIENRELKAKDVTFSANKSLSIMMAVGDKEQRELAIKVHEQAVKKSIAYVEKNLFQVQKKEHGQVNKYKAEGMVGLGFQHSMSRESDPQLHTHVLIANAGFVDSNEEKNSRSVNYKLIYNNQQKIDRIYKGYMRQELEKNGYKTRATKDGFELADVTDKQIRNFSTRTKQIDKKLNEWGLTREESTPEQRERANKSTRKSKESVNVEEIQKLWSELKKEHDIQFQQKEKVEYQAEDIQKLVEKGFKEYMTREPVLTKSKAMDEILKFSVEKNNERDKSPLLTQEDVERYLPGAMTEEKMIRLPGQKEYSGSLNEEFVSEKLMIASIENEQYMKQGKQLFKDRTENNIESKIDAAGEKLFDFEFKGEQREAAIGVLQSENFMVGIQGDPGTGKTTLLQAVAEVQGRGHMIALSKAGSAAKKLGEEINVEARTIDKFIYDYKKARELKEKDPAELDPKERKFLKEQAAYLDNLKPEVDKPGLIIVDEASMNGDFDTNELCKIGEQTECKIVFAGDQYQLPAVAAGESFKKLQVQGMETFHLKEIRRQRNEEDLKAVQAITMRHDVEASVEILKNKKDDIITEIDNHDKRLEEIQNKYLEKINSGEAPPLLITSTNSDKDTLNQGIRDALKESGEIEQTGKVFDTLNTKKQKMDLEVCRGDRIVFLKNDNDKKIGTTSGQKILNGDQIIVDAVQEDGIINGTLVDEEGRKTKNTVEFNANDYNNIDHSFALSTYKSQGQSVERDVMYHTPSASPILSKNEFLVGISRNKERVELYTDDANKMTQKASAWVNKQDALESFEDGYHVSQGRSAQISWAINAAENKFARDAEINEDRQALVDEYGTFGKAPKSKRNKINERYNDSREQFYDELETINTVQNSETDTKTEKLLQADLEKWQTQKEKNEAHFEKDRSSHRVANFYKAQNRNDHELCNKIMSFQNEKESDESSKNDYESLNERLEASRNKELFKDRTQEKVEIEIEPEPDPVDVDVEKYEKTLELQQQYEEIELQIYELEQPWTVDEKQELVNEALSKSDLRRYDMLQNRHETVSKIYDELIEQKTETEFELEHHEMQDAGRMKKLMSPGKQKEFEQLQKRYDTQLEKETELSERLSEYEIEIEHYENRISEAFEQQEAEQREELQQLRIGKAEIESELIEQEGLEVEEDAKADDKDDFRQLAEQKSEETKDPFEKLANSGSAENSESEREDQDEDNRMR